MQSLIQQAFDWFVRPTTPAPTQKAGHRAIALQGQAVSYQFERSKRRTIGFLVGADGLTVRAPRWVTIAEVESAIVEKSKWILTKLRETRERQEQVAKAATVWAHGEKIDYLGQPFILHLGALVTAIDEGQQRLWLDLPQDAAQKSIESAVSLALQRAALLLFEERLNHYAPELGVHWTSLKLSNARGRWGSAKSDGSIRLNWRLMHYRLPVIDYVVVHELSHLRHMNHSPRFWATVESILPNYALLRKELKP